MSRDDESSSLTYYLLSVLGVLVVCYVLGAAVSVFRPAPFNRILAPILAPLRTIYPRQQLPERQTGTPPSWYVVRESGAPGVTTNRERDDRGLTFYTSGHGPVGRLIDRDGRSLHHWTLPAHEIWEAAGSDEGDGESNPGFWRDAHLYPDGDVVALVARPGSERRAFGLLRLDRQSEPIWAHTDRVHHELDVGPDGDIWVLARRKRRKKSNPVPDVPGMPPSFWEDTILRLSEEGRPKAEISLIDALDRSQFRELLHSAPQLADDPGESLTDPLQANSIDVVEEPFAERRAFAEPGDLLVSLRSLDAVVLVRPESRRVVWATRGVWWHPSDVDDLGSGKLLVFDQDGHGGPGLPSRALRYDPVRGGAPWSYGGDTVTSVWSRKGGYVEALSDGRTLISSSMMGSIHEVDRSGEVLWAYRNPVRTTRQNRKLRATIWSVDRLRRSELSFELEGSE